MTILLPSTVPATVSGSPQRGKHGQQCQILGLIRCSGIPGADNAGDAPNAGVGEAHGRLPRVPVALQQPDLLRQTGRSRIRTGANAMWTETVLAGMRGFSSRGAGIG